MRGCKISYASAVRFSLMIRFAAALPWRISQRLFNSQSVSTTIPVHEKFDAFIALGSNLGDRVAEIEKALDRLKSIGEVVATSHLYESSPMYFLDQSAFINAACHIKTKLGPFDLLAALKAIEVDNGREKTFRNGPRVIDLDIILHGSTVLGTPNLEIPHPRLGERRFVLLPMVDLNPDIMHPGLNASMRQLLDKLPLDNIGELSRVIPVGKHRNGTERLIRMDDRVYVAAILNMTPDR